MPSATTGRSEVAVNELLDALSAEEYQRLAQYLRPVTLSLGEVIYEPGETQNSIYFPTTSVISLIYTTSTGASAEIGVIGNDGIVGVACLLGSNGMPYRAVTLITGKALTARVAAIQNEFCQDERFQYLVLRYVQSLLMQVSQTAVCNRLHSIEQRLCRWLLMCRERARSDELLMTQEFISHMLGGRRESVTVAAGRLQDAGIIQYARGHIRILDLARLEKAACECYRTVREECNKLQNSGRKWMDSSSVGEKSSKKCS